MVALIIWEGVFEVFIIPIFQKSLWGFAKNQFWQKLKSRKIFL